MKKIKRKGFIDPKSLTALSLILSVLLGNLFGTSSNFKYSFPQNPSIENKDSQIKKFEEKVD
ncbi:MAG: hypothetical protein NZ866_02790, partial [Patescibacteria group bacterium]|nr:hypothetical protein [Patescibacteria group bacterium]